MFSISPMASDTHWQSALARCCSNRGSLWTFFWENSSPWMTPFDRNLAPRYVRPLKSVVTKTVHSFDPTLRITRGKKVLEVRPQISWGKGNAVLKMLHTNKPQRRRVSVFIGDDTTDEDVFRALRPMGITVRVGKSTSTNAQYYVKNVEAVMTVLRSIISLRRDLLPRRRLSAKP